MAQKEKFNTDDQIAKPILANPQSIASVYPEMIWQEINETSDIRSNGKKIRLTVKDSPSLWVDYWAVNVPPDHDRWRFELSHSTSKTQFKGPFSHLSEHGCWISAKAYFVENGLISTPQDNSHLSPQSADILRKALSQKNQRRELGGLPEVGDIIEDSISDQRRICIAHSDRCQVTTSMRSSYYLLSNGAGSFSGGCGQSIAYCDLETTHQTKPVVFWMFKDGRAGAGRGVDLWLPVTVWRYNGIFGPGLWGKG